MNEKELKELLLASQRGDKSSYQRFLQLILPVVETKCRRSVFHQNHADDVIQESMLAIHKGLGTYDGKRPVLPWIHAIVHHKLIDYLRKCSRTQEDYVGETLEQIPSQNENVTNETASANELLGGLPENLLRPLLLTKVEGHSTKEAAKILGVNENALRTRLSRAYTKLKNLLEERGYDDKE